MAAGRRRGIQGGKGGRDTRGRGGIAARHVQERRRRAGRRYGKTAHRLHYRHAAGDAGILARVRTVDHTDPQARAVLVGQVEAQMPRAQGRGKVKAGRRALCIHARVGVVRELEHTSIFCGICVKRGRRRVVQFDFQPGCAPPRQVPVDGLEVQTGNGADLAEVHVQPQRAVLAHAAPLPVHVGQRGEAHAGARRREQVRPRVWAVDGIARAQRHHVPEALGVRPRPLGGPRKHGLRRQHAHFANGGQGLWVAGHGVAIGADGEFHDDDRALAGTGDAEPDADEVPGGVDLVRRGRRRGQCMRAAHGVVKGRRRVVAKQHLDVVGAWGHKDFDPGDGAGGSQRQ